MVDTEPRTPWEALQQIASRSGGKAWRIQTTKAIDKHLQEILNQMVPTRATNPRYFTVYRDVAEGLVWAALGLLGMLLLLQTVVLRKA